MPRLGESFTSSTVSLASQAAFLENIAISSLSQLLFVFEISAFSLLWDSLRLISTRVSSASPWLSMILLRMGDSSSISFPARLPSSLLVSGIWSETDSGLVRVLSGPDWLSRILFLLPSRLTSLSSLSPSLLLLLFEPGLEQLSGSFPSQFESCLSNLSRDLIELFIT